MSLNPLDLLFGQVRNAIENHASPDTPGPSYDPNPLLGILGGLFGQHSQGNGQEGGSIDNPAPASQDPYGDPADQGGGGQFGNVRPASEDPYGDPADQR